MSDYETYYRSESVVVHRSADAVVRLILGWTMPGSVVDVGCGTGVWLKYFLQAGVPDVLGVDGDWVDAALLEIPADKFVVRDLNRPFALDRNFDLVISLEVAEHLARESADSFVASLIALGPVVVFSAAVPDQGGPHHVNEQWPGYWAARFAGHGYVPLDWLRPRIWLDERIAWYYRQNLVVYAQPSWLREHPAPPAPAMAPLPLVHPGNYLDKLHWIGRLAQAATALAATVPPGAALAIVDSGELGALITAGYAGRPFPMTGGAFAGPPTDDVAALEELSRVRAEGYRYLVVTWSAFWWLDHYRGFSEHLHRTCAVLHRDPHLVIFRLDGSPAP